MKSATTITKTCRVVDELSTRKWLGISELSRKTGLLPSDVHRILTSLRSSGYVDQDTETRKYRLGFRLLRVGLEACQQNDLYQRTYPGLLELSRTLRVSTHLAAFDRLELEVFSIAHVNSPTGDVFDGRLCVWEPLHSSALGKAVVATLEKPMAKLALEKRGINPITRRTITDPSVLEQQLEQVRLRGYAVDQEESYEGMCCLGCPIIDLAGEPIGALSISMPTEQFVMHDKEMLAARLIAVARRAIPTKLNGA